MKYRFFEVLEHAQPWVDGGRIPVWLAKKYLSDEREGVMTPDERLTYTSAVPFEAVEAYEAYGFPRGEVRGARTVGNVIIQNTANGPEIHRIPDILKADHYYEDVGVLCFCNCNSPVIAHRMKKPYSVEIPSVETALKVIGKLLGLHGEMGNCRYTTDHQRGHFLKSDEDDWQDEFRFVFKGMNKDRWIELPPGLGRNITLLE